MSSYFLFIFSSFYLLDIGHKNGYFGNGPKYNLGVTILTLRRWCISMTDSIVTYSWNTTLYAPMQYYKIVWHFRVRLSCKYWRNITKRRCQQVEIFNHTLVCYPSRKGNKIESIHLFCHKILKKCFLSSILTVSNLPPRHRIYFLVNTRLLFVKVLRCPASSDPDGTYDVAPWNMSYIVMIHEIWLS